MARAVVGPRLPGLVGRREVERLGRGVEQHGADVDRGDAVDQRVVHLGQQRARSPPARPSTTVSSHSGRERSRRRESSLADELGELVRAARARAARRGARASRGRSSSSSTQTGLATPPARGRLQALAVARDEVQALLDALEHRVVLQARRRPRRRARRRPPCSPAPARRPATSGRRRDSGLGHPRKDRVPRGVCTAMRGLCPCSCWAPGSCWRRRRPRLISRSRSRTTRTTRRPPRSRPATRRRSAAASAATRWCGTTAPVATTNTGTSKSFSFSQPGHLRYHCQIHGTTPKHGRHARP